MIRVIAAVCLTAVLWVAAQAQFFNPPYQMLLPAPSGGGCTAAATFVANLTGGSGNANAAAYTTMICGMITDGTGCSSWSGAGSNAKLDRFLVFATTDSTSAVLDLCGNSTAVTHGSPTFTANAGFTGSTGSTVYIDTLFNPSTAGGNFTQNLAHLSVWNFNSITATVAAVGNTTSGGAIKNILYTPFTDGNFYSQVNAASGTNSGVAETSTGWFVGNRSGATAAQAYRNGSLVYSPNDTSGASVTNNIYALGVNLGGTPFGAPFQEAVVTIGGSLASGTVSSMYTRICTYLTTVHGSC